MIAIWAGKFAIWFLRRLNRRATSYPGRLAVRLQPSVLHQLSRQLQSCTIVTGTNGKTTTANLLASMLSERGPLIHNREGSNMVQGIVTVLLANATWFGRLKVKDALFEVDEASLPGIAKHVPIHLAVLTNVFRDQLDRYGELDATVNKLMDGLRQSEATVIVNGDDPLSTYVAESTQRPFVAFGMLAPGREPSALPEDIDYPKDGAFCLHCGHPLIYDGYLYGQLGNYRCDSCGFHRPTPTFRGQYNGDTLTVDVTRSDGQLGESQSYPLPVRGLFNGYNVLAAIGAAITIGMEPECIVNGLLQFKAPLGRMQTFRTNPPSVLNLVKNPTGADNVLRAIAEEPGSKIVCVLINDHAADGRDVSWLWDTRFDCLLAPSAQVGFIVNTGTRAEDMSVRMKYAGFPQGLMVTEPNVESAIALSLRQAQTSQAETLYVVTTYTGLVPAAACLRQLEGATNRDEAAVHRPSVS